MTPPGLATSLNPLAAWTRGVVVDDVVAVHPDPDVAAQSTDVFEAEQVVVVVIDFIEAGREPLHGEDPRSEPSLNSRKGHSLLERQSTKVEARGTAVTGLTACPGGGHGQRGRAERQRQN